MNCYSIFGKPCTLDELLDPEEEWEIGEKALFIEEGDNEIIGMVQAEIGLGSKDIQEIDSDDEPEVVPPPLKEVIKYVVLLRSTVRLYVHRVHSTLWRLCMNTKAIVTKSAGELCWLRCKLRLERQSEDCSPLWLGYTV